MEVKIIKIDLKELLNEEQFEKLQTLSKKQLMMMNDIREPIFDYLTLRKMTLAELKSQGEENPEEIFHTMSVVCGAIFDATLGVVDKEVK